MPAALPTGDQAMPEPHLYVGPHEGPPTGPSADPTFWNAPFGAAVAADRIPTQFEASAFFSEGRARALTARSRT